MSNATLVLTEGHGTPWNFNLFDALAWDEQSATLWSNGCQANGSRNCTKACLDTVEGPAMVWNSTDTLFTLHNCVVYPMISTAAAQGRLSHDDPSILERYGIVVNETLSDHTPGMDDWPVISDCLREMCFRYRGRDDETLCLVSDFLFLSPETFDNGTLTPKTSQEVICGAGKFVFNADLGGPGVLVSFIQQSSLLLMAWLFLTLMKWTDTDHRNRYWSWLRWTTGAAKWMTFPRVTGATFDALTDFHKTQVFFLITLQAASLFAVYDSTLLGARNFNEITDSFWLLTFVGASGTHPVILTLFALRKEGEPLRWFTLFVSFVCIIVAWISWAIMYFRDIKATDLVQQGYNPQVCGGANPGQHCLLRDITIHLFAKNSLSWFSFSGFKAALSPWSAAGALVATLELAAEKALIRFIAKREADPEPDAARSCFWRITTPTNVHRGLRFVLLVSEAWLVFATISLLYATVSMMSSQLYKFHENWTLGQIIAVAIWVPVVIEWIRLVLFGKPGSSAAY
ncbi:hypothetical protein Q7P37_009289 [Cladosporium fusiforme]